MGGGEVSCGIGELCAMVSQEAACIVRLGACCLMSWPGDSSLQEEEEDEQQEDEHKEVEEQGEMGPEPPSGGAEIEQGETEQEAEPHR